MYVFKSCIKQVRSLNIQQQQKNIDWAPCIAVLQMGTKKSRWLRLTYDWQVSAQSHSIQLNSKNYF